MSPYNGEEVSDLEWDVSDIDSIKIPECGDVFDDDDDFVYTPSDGVLE